MAKKSTPKKEPSNKLPNNLRNYGTVIFPTCDICGSKIKTSLKNPNHYEGFLDAETQKKVHFNKESNCRETFYNKKNVGEYGKQFIGLVSELPMVINTPRDFFFTELTKGQIILHIEHESLTNNELESLKGFLENGKQGDMHEYQYKCIASDKDDIFESTIIPKCNICGDKHMLVPGKECGNMWLQKNTNTNPATFNLICENCYHQAADQPEQKESVATKPFYYNYKPYKINREAQFNGIDGNGKNQIQNAIIIGETKDEYITTLKERIGDILPLGYHKSRLIKWLDVEAEQPAKKAAPKSTKPTPPITGFNGCSCHPFASWEESDKAHNQKFQIGDQVINRCNKKVGFIHGAANHEGNYVTVNYGKKPSDIELQHVAQLEPIQLATIKNTKKSKVVATKDKQPKKAQQTATEIEILGIFYTHTRPHILLELGAGINIEWLDDNPDNLLEETFYFDQEPKGLRPDNWFEIHLWLLERGFTVNEVTQEFKEYLEDREFTKPIGARDLPYYLIDKQFGYNKHNVCVYGEINVTEISIDSRKVHATANIAKASLGWAFGHRVGNKYTHSGAGGSSSGISYHEFHQYKTKEDAGTAALYYILREFESEKKKAPPAAAKVYQKAIDVVNNQIAGKPEPKAFGTLDNNHPQVKNIVATKPEPKPKVNRDDLLKFRCTADFKKLAAKIAGQTNLSIADVMHHALQALVISPVDEKIREVIKDHFSPEDVINII